MMFDAETMCGVPECRCYCTLPPGHETPHVCRCGGSYDHHGEELWVYATPPGSPTYVPLSPEDAMVRANELAQGKPLFIEARYREPVFRASRGPIKFLKVPTLAELTDD